MTYGTGQKHLRYIQTNFDELGLLVSMAHVSAARSTAELSDSDHAVLDALRRANPQLQGADLDDVHAYLDGLSDDQLHGLVSNVKGILHEMEFVATENGDGDTIYASYFPETNHPDADIHVIDVSTGRAWDVQLKATDDPAYVQDWINSHPGGQIEVTDEIANVMHLHSTGMSNGHLTAQVEDFVDRMLDIDEGPSLADHFSVLSAVSAALVVWALWARYRRGEIDVERFRSLAILATGMKAAKIGVLMVLLSIPVVSQTTMVVLIGKLLLATGGLLLEGPTATARGPRPALSVP